MDRVSVHTEQIERLTCTNFTSCFFLRLKRNSLKYDLSYFLVYGLLFTADEIKWIFEMYFREIRIQKFRSSRRTDVLFAFFFFFLFWWPEVRWSPYLANFSSTVTVRTHKSHFILNDNLIPCDMIPDPFFAFRYFLGLPFVSFPFSFYFGDLFILFVQSEVSVIWLFLCDPRPLTNSNHLSTHSTLAERKTQKTKLLSLHKKSVITIRPQRVGQWWREGETNEWTNEQRSGSV